MGVGERLLPSIDIFNWLWFVYFNTMKERSKDSPCLSQFIAEPQIDRQTHTHKRERETTVNR